MNKKDIDEIKKLLTTPKKIAIIPHKNPDGDAIGSVLAIYKYVQKLGHEAYVISPNDYPDFLKWMPQQENIIKFDAETEKATAILKQADVIFTLDFNSLSRIETLQPELEKSDAIFIMIDHHQQPDDYATYMYSDTKMSSTCEMVYHFIAKLGDEDLIDGDMATGLYAGIMTDTGSFRFPSTTSTTHRVIANLIDKGAANASIHNNIYDTNSLSKLQLLGCTLKNLVFLEDYRTVYITLSKEELNQYHYKKGDTEGLVNYGLSLKGVIFSIIFIEDTQEGFIKTSLRSKGNFDVNQFARNHFNGGGHQNAAGGRSDRSLKETIAFFLSTIKNYKKELQ